jgi:hypothetical protein
MQRFLMAAELSPPNMPPFASCINRLYIERMIRGHYVLTHSLDTTPTHSEHHLEGSVFKHGCQQITRDSKVVSFDAKEGLTMSKISFGLPWQMPVIWR